MEHTSLELLLTSAFIDILLNLFSKIFFLKKNMLRIELDLLNTRCFVSNFIEILRPVNEGINKIQRSELFVEELRSYGILIRSKTPKSTN